MDLETFVQRLDDELRTDDFADLDPSANGLQVGPTSASVEHVAFAVDAAVATAEAAVEDGADAMVTHHGYIFGELDRITGREYERVHALVEGDCALYVSHLPLDGHQRLGNAAGVADLLGLEDRSPFGRLGTEHVGQCGRTAEPVALDGVVSTLESELPVGDHGPQVLGFGPDRVETVAIVTGSGVDWLDEAVSSGADLLITGEGKQQVYHEAREAELNVILAGHYATETLGVRALAELVEQWGPTTTYLSHPTGL